MTQESTISGVLGAEHRWLDGRFEQFRQGLAVGQVNGQPFQEAVPVLHRHIYLEEEVLFPEVEAHGLVGPTTVMVMEHGQIWQSLDTIQGLLAGGASAREVMSAFNALHSVLEEHDYKEENILYPAADQLLGESGVAEVLRRVHGAVLPEGWTCRARRSAGG